MKYILLIILGLILLFGGWFLSDTPEDPVETAEKVMAASTPEEATYLIDGKGFSPEDDEVTTLFGEPAYGDIDGDGDEDAVLILIQSPGGSGTFYYAAMAINNGVGFEGTDTIFLGDRIAPQNYDIEGNKAVINYVVRDVTEPLTVQPSIGKSLYLQYDADTLQLVLVANDFEGEANPSQMTLTMQPWTWIKKINNDDLEIVPTRSDLFKLTFMEDGTFSATTDCNSVSGSYEALDDTIIFENVVSTLMFCADSNEADFMSVLNDAVGYHFTSKGELILDLKSGTATFR